MAGLFGAAMFYDNSMITPAVSVLSAVEGLHQVSAKFGSVHRAARRRDSDRAVPVSATRHGGRRQILRPRDGAVVRLSRGGRGVYRTAQHPDVLRTLSPIWAWALVHAHPLMAGRGDPRADRRRSAVCRYRPFRTARDSSRVAVRGFSVDHHRLFRTDRDDAFPARLRATAVFFAAPS